MKFWCFKGDGTSATGSVGPDFIPYIQGTPHLGPLSGRLGMPQGTSEALSSPIIIHTGRGNPLSQKTTSAQQVTTGYINANDLINEIPQRGMLVEVRWTMIPHGPCLQFSSGHLPTVVHSVRTRENTSWQIPKRLDLLWQGITINSDSL